MIKKVLLATAALATLSTAALAADLPSRRAPPVYVAPVPVFSWTGFYVGGQAGYAFGRDGVTVSGAGVPLASASDQPNGFLGGAHAGYNFSTQSLPLFGGVLGTGGVVGIEGDVDAGDYTRATTIGAVTGSVRNNIQGSVRGRLGFAVDRTLFYATGGVAFGNFNTAINNAGVGTDSFSTGRVGWTAGAGVEYAFTNNWSFRAEYRYTDFGSFSKGLNLAVAGAPGFTARYHETENRVQVGFSYKFDTFAPAPVVARY